MKIIQIRVEDPDNNKRSWNFTMTWNAFCSLKYTPRELGLKFESEIERLAEEIDSQ